MREFEPWLGIRFSKRYRESLVVGSSPLTLRVPYVIVRKTSVYLPDELKAALAAASERWGRSEAEIIRLAVEQFVAPPGVTTTNTSPAARQGIARHGIARQGIAPRGPRLIGVGVGPGAPDLLTDRARLAMTSADRVFAAATAPDAIGRAETIVRTALPEVMIDRLVWTIAPDHQAPISRADSRRAAAEQVVKYLDRNEVVVFVTIGDPNVFSAFPSLAAAVRGLRPDVPIATVPGVMAFQELAAQSQTVVADSGQDLHIITLLNDVAALDQWLTNPDDAIVVYKGGGRNLPTIAEHLAEHDRLDRAVIGELLGLPGERAEAVAAHANRPASYLATVIVPPRPQEVS